MKIDRLLLTTGVMLAGLFMVSCAQQEIAPAVLEAEISGLDEQVELMMFYVQNRKSNLDTVAVGPDGQFTYRASLEEPVMVRMSQIIPPAREGEMRPDPVIPRGVQFIFEPGSRLTLNADVSDDGSFAVAGDAKNEAYWAYSEQYGAVEQAYYDVISRLREEADDLGSEEQAELEAERDELRGEMNDIRAGFIAENPDNYGALYEIAINSHRYEDNIDELDQLLSSLSEELQQNSMGRAIRSQIDGLRATARGTVAPDFIRPEMDGDTLQLSDYRGKHVVLSFWGSWCGPCRASHPALKEMYEKYNEKGLEIISISEEKEDTYEESREAWLEAIEEDGIDMWPHVLNNEGNEEMDIVAAYGIAGFPTKFLLDEEGRVVDRYLGGYQGLLDKLDEIYEN